MCGNGRSSRFFWIVGLVKSACAASWLYSAGFDARSAVRLPMKNGFGTFLLLLGRQRRIPRVCVWFQYCAGRMSWRTVAWMLCADERADIDVVGVGSDIRHFDRHVAAELFLHAGAPPLQSGMFAIEVAVVERCPATKSPPRDVPTGVTKRVPSARTGNGSTRGEMPARGFPEVHVCPKSLLDGTVVMVLKPSWLGRIAVALSES